MLVSQSELGVKDLATGVERRNCIGFKKCA